MIRVKRNLIIKMFVGALLFLLAPVRVYSVGFTPTTGGLVVDLKQNTRILISVMVDHDNNPSTPAREYFVENYTRYTGDDYFVYDPNDPNHQSGRYLRLAQQGSGATEPSETSIWTVDSALTRVDVHNLAKGGANKNYSLGGISYTIWNDGKTLRTTHLNGNLYQFYGDLEEDATNDKLCDVVFVIPTARSTITSFDPNKTLTTAYGRTQDAQGRFNGEIGTGFLGMTYREVYMMIIPRFNSQVSYTNAGLLTFNTTRTNKSWSAGTIKSGQAAYAFADDKHKPTTRTVFRLYILDDDQAFNSCPDSYFFAYDEQNTLKYRQSNTLTDSTAKQKIYTQDHLFCMDRVGETKYHQTGLMNVPVPDSTFYYVGYMNDYRAAVSGQSMPSGSSHSQFTKIRQLPMNSLPGFYAPAGAYGRMIADTTSSADNVNVKFEPARYFFRTSSGVNVELRQVDDSTWIGEEMWYIDGAYMLLSGEVLLGTEPEFSLTEQGVPVAGWSEMVPASTIPVYGKPGETAAGKTGWPRIHTNRTAKNGGIEFVEADPAKYIRYHNNGHYGEDLPDEHPAAGKSKVAVDSPRLIQGYQFICWTDVADTTSGSFTKYQPGDSVTLSGVLHLYAQAKYTGTINVAISFVKEDGERYFLTHPQLLSPRYARARHYEDWTEVRQGLRNAENNDPNYLSSYNILGKEGICERCGTGEYVLDPHREVMHGAEDSLVYYEDYSPGTEEYLGLYYATPNTVIANSTWAGLFTSSAGWPTPTTPCVTSTRLSSTHYLDGYPDDITRMERWVDPEDHSKGILPSNIVYNAEDDQFDGTSGAGTDFMISGVGVVDAHYVIIPDTTEAWRDEIVFDLITEPHPHELVWSKLIGKQLLAQMKVGDEIIYFHPDRDKTCTTANDLRLSSGFRLRQTFTFIPDVRVTSVDDDDRPSMETTGNDFSRTIIGGHDNPINVTYQGNYIDIVDTLRIMLVPATGSKIKEYYGRWKDDAVDSVLPNGFRYHDVLIRTKTFHYGAMQSRFTLTPEYGIYTFSPLAGNTRTINFTLAREVYHQLLDLEGNVVGEEVVATEDVTTSLALGPGACSFATGGVVGVSEAVYQHVTLAALAENKTDDNLDTLLISTTVRIDGVDYPVTGRVPLVQTSLEGDELIWSVYEGKQRYYIMAGTGGLIFRKYKQSGSTLYKEGTNTPLVKGSANAANNDTKYITPWRFRYNPLDANQLSLKTEYGVDRYLKMLGDAVGSNAGIHASDSSFFTIHYVHIYVNDNANEEEQVKLQYGADKWLQFTLTGGSGAELKLVDDEEDASVFSWSYLLQEHSLLNNGTYPSRDTVTFGYNTDMSVGVQTRYKAYKEYSMLVGNAVVYLCREEEKDMADLISGGLEWQTSYNITRIPDGRTFDKEDPGDPDPVSGISTSLNTSTLTTTVSTSGATTSPTNVKIDGKYVNIVDTLHVTLRTDRTDYRFKGDWSSFKSVDDAELKIPLIRKTYHTAEYDSLACVEQNEEYNHVFPNTITTPVSYVFHLATKQRTGEHVLDVAGNVVAVESVDEEDKTSLMHLGNKSYAEIQLIDEFGGAPTWCRLGTKGSNTIEVICTQSGIRSPRTAYIYIAYFLSIDDKMRFVNYRLSVSQPSLYVYDNNQHLVHRSGASGDPLDAHGMQQVHENKRILYYYPDQDVELPIRENHFFGWWRWFREGDGEVGDSDIPEEVWRTKPVNTGGSYNFPFRIIGDSVLIDDDHPELGKKLVTQGRYTVFHYKSSQYPDVRNNPPVKMASVAPPVTTYGEAVKPTVTYAVDISNYYDGLPFSVRDKNQVDTARLDTMTAIPEPTLSLREVFELHPWTEMAERMESYKSTRTTDDAGTYPLADEHYLEDHIVMAPLGNQLLLPTEQRYNGTNVEKTGHSESLLGYYMRDDHWSDGGWNDARKDSMIWCGGWDASCQWYTYNPKTQKYSSCSLPITSGDDFLKVPAKSNITSGQEFDTVYYCLRSRSWSTTGDPGVDEDSEPGAYMFNICRYMIIYHAKNLYGPKVETTTSGVTKAIITNDEIEQRYEVLERLNFDYNKPGSEYTVYPHPLPWADASYGYTYPETPDLPHNRLHTQSDLPNFGEYGLVNRVHYTDYWYDMEQHGGAANGYMIYCDGMSSSGQVAALSLTAQLCSGQKMFFSCYVGNPSKQSGKANPNFTFEVQGSENGTTWENITSYMTGDIAPSRQWYQIYFPIIFNEAKEYQHFRVRIYNMSSAWDGNDFTLDDMCIFATKPPLIAYQANTACKEKGDEETPTHVLLRVDYQGITGEGYNDKEVYYTVKCVNKERVMSFVPMIDGYLQQETHPKADISKPDTICGKLYIPGITYDPSDEDSIFVNMNELIDTFTVSMTKHEENSSYPIFNEGYIYEILEGSIRPVKYVVHSAYMNPVDTFTVHMSAEYKELLSSLCGMTSYLKISNQMVLELNGEEVPDTEQDDLCANATYDIGLRVKGSLYLDNTAPVSLNGTCVNDWLLYGDTAADKSVERYGHPYADIVKVVKDILRCEPPGTTNGNQFAPNLAAVSHNEMLRIQKAQNVQIGGTSEPAPGSPIDPYVILADLVNNGFLTLYRSNMTATVYAGDSVQYVIFPILGTGTDALHSSDVDVCPLPLLIKLKPNPSSEKTPLIVGGLNRLASEMNQPIVVLASASASNHEIVLKVDSIMPMVGIRSVNLLSTDDPDFHEGTHTLSFTPDLGYPAEEYYTKGSDIVLHPSSGNNYYMKQGYTYTFGILMQTALGKDTLDGGCPVGTVPFTLSVVPDYLRWDPEDDTSNQWNKPGNWIGIDNHNQPISSNTRFAPLATTAIIIPTLTDGRPYPELPDLTMPATYDSVKQVGFTYNTCDYIRFLPGAAMGQQQRLDYGNAIVDMSLPNTAWALRSAPVKGMISGDLFMANADLDGTSLPWEVGAFDAAGRSWKTGNASFWLSVYSRTTTDKGNGVNVADTTRTAKAEWSKVTNGMTLSLPPASGFAVYTHTKAEKAADVRLPKNDDIYYYYNKDGEKQLDLYEPNLQTARATNADGADKVGKLAFHSASESYTITNDNEVTSTAFVFGNPTMGYIDIWGFIADNALAGLSESFRYIDGDRNWQSVSKSYAESTSNIITTKERYLPPMHAIELTTTSRKALTVTLNANRIVTAPVAMPSPAPKRSSNGWSKGIMTITVVNPADASCTSRLLLGQGYHDAILDGEDAVLTTVNVDKFSTTSYPATPFNIYSLNAGNGMSIDLRDSIVSVPISFFITNGLPYEPVTYLWFTGVSNLNGPLYFYDALTDTERLIVDGIRMEIATPETSHETRYYIRRHVNAQGGEDPIGTSVEPTATSDEKAIKILHNGQVFILRSGHVYTVFGQKLR